VSRILVVDDDQASARTLELHLRAQGFETAVAHDAEAGLARASDWRPDLVILDVRMPGRSGLDVLPDLKALDARLHVVVITAFHDMETTIEAMQKGAEEYIHKPVDVDELDAAVVRLLETPREEEAIETALAAGTTTAMVGGTRAMKEIFKTIGLVARGSTMVLVTGESGTGKELVARAIHEAGERPEGPFVVVNCAAVVETLLESDMFGHEKGAFTGAVTRQPGKFELADSGTIFLDEIGEMSPAMQAKLLRVLQYKEFTPLGARRSVRTNARIIAATNARLEEKVAAGTFREDLFYRLQVVTIHLPPLRERMDDLPALVSVLLGRINDSGSGEAKHISREALACLAQYHWPGNVRELENVLMKAAALCPVNVLTPDLFPAEVCGVAGIPNASVPDTGLMSLEAMEKAHVARVLEATGWHRGQACEILGVSRPRLRRMIRQYELSPPPGVAGEEEPDID
jgi:DNA-binding NtrC family response regulator